MYVICFILISSLYRFPFSSYLNVFLDAKVNLKYSRVCSVCQSFCWLVRLLLSLSIGQSICWSVCLLKQSVYWCSLSVKSLCWSLCLLASLSIGQSLCSSFCLLVSLCSQLNVLKSSKHLDTWIYLNVDVPDVIYHLKCFINLSADRLTILQTLTP